MALLARTSRKALAAGFVCVTAACAPARDPESAWTMPALSSIDLATAGVDGYPFAHNGSGQGADAVVHEGEVRGDLPEMAMGRRSMWRVSERKALAEARAQGRGVVIDFWAEWCDSCWRLERETYAEPELRRAMLEQFVPVRIDVTEETHANREQLQRYAIVSLPTVLVLDSKGRVVDRIDEFLSSDDLLLRLAKARSRRQVQARAR